MPISNHYILHIASLIHKVREREILSPEEAEELILWRQADPGHEQSFHQLLDGAYLETELRALFQVDYAGAAADLYEQLGIPSEGAVRRIPGYRYWLSAAVLLFLCIGVYLWRRPAPGDTGTGQRPSVAKIDVAPGKQGAVLTLADGSTVVLDSLGNGLVATQGGSRVLLQNGQLAYEKNKAAAPPAFNTMTTPKGRQFRLVLPDGTKVWLDAASSLRYPTAFVGAERRVEITGEAYFEVEPLAGADGQRLPFIVDIDHKMEVDVLGTHFNINAYRDESVIRTTLLEGAVKVVRAGESAVLKPGQQAQVSDAGAGQNAGVGHAVEGSIHIIPQADVEKVMAWKNGVFDFQDVTLEDVMRQLQRWYDIEVVYEKGIPKIEFIGKMGRDLSLNTVLSGLEMSKVHFRLEEGKRLVVLP